MIQKELKIKDIMVGDWVDVRNNAAPNTPHLERITPSHFLRDEHWYGIELVPEILEKNGFAKLEDESGKQRYRWEYADGIHISIDFTDTDPWVHVSNRCYFAVPYCEYVHQLQHALRLCGIDKEITL